MDYDTPEGSARAGLAKEQLGRKMIPVTVVGNLGKDPEMSFTSSGLAKANFSVAVTERKKGEDGRWADGETTWVDVVVWRNLAENVCESLTKGSKVIVVGNWKKRTFEKKDGTKGSVWELEASDVGPALSLQSARLTKVTRDQRREAGLQTIGDILGGEIVQNDTAPF